MIVNISELEKGNGELYIVHGNLNIIMVCLRFSKIMLLYLPTQIRFPLEENASRAVGKNTLTPQGE